MTIDPEIRGLVQAHSTKAAFSETLAEAGRQEGFFRGQSVVQIAQGGTLAAAAEEMSFAAAEKVEKKLAELKAGSKESLRASAAELADRYVNMTGESQSSHKLQQFLESLKKLGGKATEDQIRQMARDAFGDVSDQWAALGFAEEALAAEGGDEAEALREKVAAARHALMEEAGPAIRAGINIAGDVLAFARKGLEQVGQLRTLYRFAVLGAPSPRDMYESIISRYGTSRFAEAVDLLIRAAGSDLGAHGMGPSMEKAHLEEAVNNISFVQHLGNLHRALDDLMNRVQPAPIPGHGRR